MWIAWTIDFIPDESPAAKGISEVTTRWMDVEGPGHTRCSTSLKGAGKNGRFTYPDDKPERTKAPRARNEWVVDHDATIVGTAGHLHPGGLYTDLTSRATGRRHLFRSKAQYYEPAGPVSWDVSMAATPRTGGSPSRRATSSPSTRPTRPGRLLVRVDGDHARW